MWQSCISYAHLVRYSYFKLLLLSLLQFKFALVLVGRPQFINEESEFFINLQDFKNHPNQGMVDNICCWNSNGLRNDYVMLQYRPIIGPNSYYVLYIKMFCLDQNYIVVQY